MADQLELKDSTSDGPSSAAKSQPRKLPKKRAKTGCLTCRKRRIKCGEEKPICNNCIKSKRICEGYVQRVVFKNPLGVFGSYGHHGQDAQMQQSRVSHKDFPLPAQHAAAAAQHPMLAPRPVDPYSSAQSDPQANGGATPFYYPAPIHAPQQWQDLNQDSSTDGIVHQSNTQHAPEQYPHPITNWDSIESQDYLAGPLPQTDANHVESGPIFCETGYQYPQQHAQLPTPFSPGPLIPPSQPQVIYVDIEAEDHYDLESDEEIFDHTQTEGFNQLNLIMASANRDDGRLRSFTTHLNEPNVLATYYPTLSSSPLNNPKTARIFAHFIHSTGPSLSMFERHPTDASIDLGAPVPPAQRSLWAYTLPLKALEHPALLQSILAISSLHIAYLQGVPTTVSLKHYHFALKRIGRAVGLPTRRKQIGTLAATQLLAYYEVISADHTKWNSHIAGAVHLIREVDWAGTTRDIRAYRRIINEQRSQMGWTDSSMYYHHALGADVSEDDPFAAKEATVDQVLISAILGRVVDWDQFGHVDEGYSTPFKKNFSRKDIETYRIQCDLYWWFTKQDVFHSLISGEKLFLPYYLHGQCPPRAGIGRIDAIYGSSDHLWLLLARVSEFGHRDRKRKLKALRTAGTDWRPTPGMFRFMGRFSGGSGPPGGPPRGPPGPPGGSRPTGLPKASPSGPPNPGSGPASGPPSASSQASPPMYGMVPPSGPARVPVEFVEDRRGQPTTPEEEDHSEDTTYNDAEKEWEEILVAMDTFFRALGRDFQPLPADVTATIPSPFGPALQYRTTTIAVILGFYYAGRILLHRFHPSMPPAMMMAAGVAAPTTAELAQIIGRITAGIYSPQSFNLQAGSLSPTLGSSLTEMTMPVFFAAVQYIDAAQRHWIVSQLRDVSRLTGWKTSDAIAGGCEKAWIIAASQGRGPPYERSFQTDRNREILHNDVLIRAQVNESDDRRFMVVHPPDRAHLAMGLLSLEGDMQNLEI
ncbi:hypothetical protein N7495_000348 [Penicillium taxi]|uniref:uncharacterized protein n=1 Tax=Penicillium taxi TaxID=168475 RepID=UPI00254557CA|nr:uncharacterized protein N7495_000348 [Penicillium taxi]KAJ5907666.1 hypothetical protein N7495_000348 [Penicillium taxi]